MRAVALRTRLSIIYAAWFALVLLGLGFFFYHLMAARLDANVNDELEELAAGVRGYIQFRAGSPQLVYDQDDPEQAYFIQRAARYLQVYDADTGRLIEQSPAMQLLDADLPPADIKELAANPRLDEVILPGVHLRFHNTVFYGPGREPFLLRIGSSLQPVQSSLATLLRSLLLLIPLGVLAAAAGGWWMARLALAPLEELRLAAHRISISQLETTLPVRGAGDELDRLAETFNDTFARLHRAVQQMREFSASIAHELRTPLTVLRGSAEVALLEGGTQADYQRVLSEQLEELEKLTRLVNELLLLARAEAGELPVRLNPLDLSRLAQTVAEQVIPLADYKSVALRIVAPGPVWVNGDAQWLERVIVNLLDNAVKFTPAGGAIAVEVARAQDHAELRVRDSGVGISAEALPHVFERFYRADPSRSRDVEGAGLGLSLARWLVEAHHGAIRVESRPGEGSCFTVEIPLADAVALA